MRERAIPPWLISAACAAAVIALAVWSAWHRWLFLDESPYPIGIDGWFYPTQLRALLDTGQLRYPSSPLGFWLLAPFAAVTDPIVGAKLGAAVLGALIAVPAYFVGRRLGGGRPAGLLAAALATSSAGSFYLSVEFVKNGIGLTVATTYLWMLLRALERPVRGRLALAALTLCAAVLTHKMAAALAVVISVPAIAVEARARGVIGPWRIIASPWRLIAAAAATLAVALAVLTALSALFPGRFLGTRELALGDGALSATARWAIPALDNGRRQIWIGHEAAIGGVVALALLGVLAVRRFALRFAAPEVRPAELAVAITLAAVSLAIALPWLAVDDPQGIGFRLRIAAFLPMALAAAALAGALAGPLRNELRVAAIVGFAAAWTYAQPTRRDEGVVRTHPVMAEAAMGLPRVLPADAVVICPERHILFIAAYYTDHEVRLRPDGVPAERRWRLMPLAFVKRGLGPRFELDQALLDARGRPELVPPRGLHARAPNGLVLVPEATWAWVIEQLPAGSRSRERATNWPTI